MNQQPLVEHVYALTQSIAHAAALADWSEAARLVAQRSPLLMSIGAQQDAHTLDIIKRIQALDADVLGNAQTTSVELKAEFSAAMSRVSAANSYQRMAKL